MENTPETNPKMHMPPGYGGKVHTGPVLAILIIVLVLILGGLYIWGALLSKDTPLYEEPSLINNEPETPRAEADRQIFEIVSPSDDLSAIETDIESTNLDTLDTDVHTIGIELDAALRQ